MGNPCLKSFLLVLALTGWLPAQAPRPVMTITYTDGSSQSIPLQNPSCEIARIDFSAGVQGATYTDSHGAQVFVPCGRLAFADRLSNYRVGDPKPIASAQTPQEALGEPNFDQPRDTGYVTLGCGGSITLEFSKVRLVDIEGPDIHVFEVGADLEPTQLEISPDGKRWINIGRISGGKASVDIRPFVKPGERFRFVRLTDLKTACAGKWPGADLDAVAAIGCIAAE